MEEKLQLTAKTARVIEIMKSVDGPMFSAEIAEVEPEMFEKGAKSVSAIMTGLSKRGFVVSETADYKTVDAEGKEVTKQLKRYSLTDEGMNAVYDIKA